jgi:bifunctional DNA-binding transcriptional regulator/antitoxin component of YhaV-PrlF toxin-antitoxin module
MRKVSEAGAQSSVAKTLTAEARIRGRNQITIPDAIVRQAGIEPGDTFVVELEPDEPETLRLRRVRASYAGALRGLWGNDSYAYLEAERKDWG